jgi:dihydrofolate synthase/folylpolyglutamate synthase
MEFETPTFFEFITAVAFEYFRDKGIDIAVVEVGLGGRLDSTNVLKPEISIITNVSLEHTDILGNTIEEITEEKAGIIKPRGTVIMGSDDVKVIEKLTNICRERNARLLTGSEIQNVTSTPKSNSFDYKGTSINVPLGGMFQLRNISCALEAMSLLRVPPDAIKEGLEKVKWPGRFETVNETPTVILDGAKDADSMRKVMESLNMIKYDELYTVLSVSKDKLVSEIVKETAKKTDHFIITKHKVNGRGLDTEALAKETGKTGKDSLVIEDVKEAVKKAMELANHNDLILVTGSLFTAAEARELWFKNKSDFGREFNENLNNNRI